MTDPAPKTRFLPALALCALLLAPAPSSAQQLAPTPRAAPRLPVNREALYESRAAAARDIQGQALIIDGDKLKIGGADLRLFGVVPPALSASFGPQARGVLDALTANQDTACRVRDRDRDGRLLATCRTAAGVDPALELLRRGLAVSARGSLADTDLAAPYLAAEQAAQAQHLGLWSAAPPPPVSAAAINEAAKTDLRAAEASALAGASAAALPPPTPATALPIPAPPASQSTPPTPPTAALESKADQRREEKTAKALAPAIDNAVQLSASLGAIPQVAVSQLGPGAEEMILPASGFFARYQILLACLLMLVTAAGILSALAFQRRHEKRDEMKAIAAALRGELMAMRAICQTRLKTMQSEADDRAATWPKLRATLYQAYVGRIGFLGADLARQVAAIYGQSSDYAAYYAAHDDGRVTATPKKQALQMLSAYIEEVLPRLAGIEQTGQRPYQFGAPPAYLPPAYVAEAPRIRAGAAAQPSYRPARPAAPAMPPPARSRSLTVMPAEPADAAPQGLLPPPAAPAPPAASAPVPAPPGAYTPGAPAKLWESLRHFARAQLGDRFGEKTAMPDDDGIGDYTSLIEQDMATLSFGDDELSGDLLQPPEPKRRGTNS